MPYIKVGDRDALAHGWDAHHPGELNYVITRAVNDYLRLKGTSYQTINDITGALENAKLEFYRRVAVPYENSKLALNGDVYT